MQGKTLEGNLIAVVHGLRRQGYSVRGIASKLSLSTSTVFKYLKRVPRPAEKDA